MNSKEIEYELSLPYFKLVDYLKEKYGKAKCDYFCNKKCRSVNKKVRRRNEGLDCHHIYEAKYANLSCKEKIRALQFPYKFQRRENLVYCNLIEHFILHIKIAIMDASLYDSKQNDPVINNGATFLAHSLNEGYEKTFAEEPSEYFKSVEENYWDYVYLISSLEKFWLTHWPNGYIPDEEQSKNGVENIKGIDLLFDENVFNNEPLKIGYKNIRKDVTSIQDDCKTAELCKLWGVDYLFGGYAKVKLDHGQYWCDDAKEYVEHAYPEFLNVDEANHKQLVFGTKENSRTKMIDGIPNVLVRGGVQGA